MPPLADGVIVQEWIARRGGSENVFLEFAAALPDAALACLWNDDAGERLGTRRVAESWLARTPLRGHKAAALPFMLPTWRALPGDFEWALISSHLFAHHARFRGSTPTRKLVYAHTPARYIWAPELDERGRSLAVRVASSALRPLDKARAAEPQSIAANSAFVRERIRRAWGREAHVIHPPVDIERIQGVDRWADQLSESDSETLSGLPREFILGASRFVPYKRLENVIAAAERVGVPAVIAGAGPAERELRAYASGARVPVHFVIAPTDPLLFALYERALAFVFPAVEDFGIMPVEAMATGTPAIVNAVGGAREALTAISGGATWDLSPASFPDAFAVSQSIDRARLRTDVRHFSRERFRREILNWVSEEIGSDR